MSGNGIAQIVIFLARRDGAHAAARHLHGAGATRTGASPAYHRCSARSSAASTGSSRIDPSREQDWKGYAKRRAGLQRRRSSPLLYAILRLQGHLFLNPDDLPGVPSHIALNTTASFVTNTNWQYYGGEYTMSYLTQMAGLAVQNFVSAARRHGRARRRDPRLRAARAGDLGNFWVDLYRSLVYILLPLAVVLGVILLSQGVVQTFDAATRPRRRSRARRSRRSPAARSRSQIAIKQLGTNGGGFYNSNSAVPFENPNGADELPRDALDPADPGRAGRSCSGRWSAPAGRPGWSSRRCSRSS